MSIEECRKIIKDKLARKLNVSIAWDGYYDSENLEGHFEADRETGNTFPFDQTRDSIRRADNLNGAEAEKLRENLDKINGVVDEAVKRIGSRYCPNADVNRANQIPDAVFDRAASDIERKHPRDLVIVAPDLWLPIVERR